MSSCGREEAFYTQTDDWFALLCASSSVVLLITRVRSAQKRRSRRHPTFRYVTVLMENPFTILGRSIQDVHPDAARAANDISDPTL
jgi:hypothetical protein